MFEVSTFEGFVGKGDWILYRGGGGVKRMMRGERGRGGIMRQVEYFEKKDQC